MRLIKPSFIILEQKPGIEGVYKAIEEAGRTCYQSSHKIIEGSAKDFTDRMIKSGHGAMLEHGTVYLIRNSKDDFTNEDWNNFIEKYKRNQYSKIKWHPIEGNHGNICITTNYRVLVENDWLDDLKCQCEPTKYHERRISVRFICDRGISHEFVRHRVFSFAQESTRFCNYSKDKFGNEITYIIPNWLDLKEGIYECFEDGPDISDFWANYNPIGNELWERISGLTEREKALWLKAMDNAEITYLELIKVTDKEDGPSFWTAQQARSVLPNSLKTELVMTGFVSDWQNLQLQLRYEDKNYPITKGFFGLRNANSAHIQAQELAAPLEEEFKKLGYVI